MRTKAERRNSELKEFKKRLKLCIDKYGYGVPDEDYVKHKRDLPHSQGSNWWNAFETKRMNNKKERLKEKLEIKQEISESED